MAEDEDDDLYDEEFDFVDEDDDEEDRDDSDDASDVGDDGEADESPLDETNPQGDDEPVDEYGRPEPKPDYVVHIYENQKFKRTIDRPFTAEDAEAFATEYNRTSKSYARFAVTSKNDVKPKKALDRVTEE